MKRSTFVSTFIAILGSAIAFAFFAPAWELGAQGTIPAPPVVEVGDGVVNTDTPNADGQSEPTVRVGSATAQVAGDNGETMEGVTAFGAANGSTITLPSANLSNWSDDLLAEILGGTTINTEEMFDVFCLTDDGRWTKETVTTTITQTPVMQDGEVVDYIITITVEMRQGGTCAVFVDRDNSPNVDVQERADLPANLSLTGDGGISGKPEFESFNLYGTVDQ